MQTIHYPSKGRKLEDVITQDTLDLVVAQLEDWHQGPGTFGRLHLHPCWNKSSVLDRRYQGESTFMFRDLMHAFQRLYERTGQDKWLLLCHSMASQLLYLQSEEGGFIHCTSEFEPTFDTRGCPIHFFLPVITLCEYYLWPHADKLIRSRIPDALDRQWEWSLKHSWMVGNGRFHPLDHPGWCGVTNQDLTAIAAVALCGKAFGTWDRYEQYAKPALDHLLSPAYYYPEIGLFERGDGVNYAERTVYYTITLNMLILISEVTGDPRLPGIIDNVTSHLFDALFTGPDGLTYLARGAITSPDDKSRVLGWENGAIAFSGYPELITLMEGWLGRHPCPERKAQLESLKDTLAAYIFSDGTIPPGIFSPSPLFTLASSPATGAWLLFILDFLGDAVQDPRPVRVPSIHRQLDRMTWKTGNRLWSIEEDGVRRYGGYTRFPGGLTIGPDEKPIWGDYASLENCDVLEILDIKPPKKM